MAGTNASFNAGTFRDAIHFVMAMAKPSDVQERAIFSWTPRKTFAREDSGFEPFDWTAVPTATIAPAPVEVPCAISIGSSAVRSEETPMGQIDPVNVQITILDTDYPLIFDTYGVKADIVTIDGNTYGLQYEFPAVGLFDVTVHTLVAQARDES